MISPARPPASPQERPAPFVKFAAKTGLRLVIFPKFRIDAPHGAPRAAEWAVCADVHSVPAPPISWGENVNGPETTTQVRDAAAGRRPGPGFGLLRRLAKPELLSPPPADRRYHPHPCQTSRLRLLLQLRSPRVPPG